jgi:hypothetical protein
MVAHPFITADVRGVHFIGWPAHVGGAPDMLHACTGVPGQQAARACPAGARPLRQALFCRQPGYEECALPLCGWTRERYATKAGVLEKCSNASLHNRVVLRYGPIRGP